MIVKLNEQALLNAGFDKAFVEFLRHTMRQLGQVTGQTTLPEVAAYTDTLTPIVNNLVIELTATQVEVADLEVADTDLPPSTNHLSRRMDDMQAEFDGSRIERSALAQALEDMKADAERSRVTSAALLRAIDDLQAATDIQNLNIADLRRRISQLEDAQT